MFKITFQYTLLFIIGVFFLNNLNANVYYNYGINSFKKHDTNKIYLTIDMCPSLKESYDVELFQSLISLSKKYNKTIPVGIAVSGRWVLKHLDAIVDIKNIEKQGYIEITWINHGYRHYYNPQLNDSDNFMIHTQEEASDDIQKNYNLMYENGIKASKFFRFPGLMSNDFLNEIVENMGFMILGTNAWFAKNNGKFKGGDIILIHGNRNEEAGVDLFLKHVKNNAFDNFEFSSLDDFNSYRDYYTFK